MRHHSGEPDFIQSARAVSRKRLDPASALSAGGKCQRGQVK
jgi:hypothetical protein